MNILDTILASKRDEVAAASAAVSLEAIKRKAFDQTPARSFTNALTAQQFALIAEVKKASPSRGILVADFEHVRIAQEYARGGAHALSVLTDQKFFLGDPRFIREIKNAIDLPVLRKDFIIDEYQIYESRALGADAVLLLVRILSFQHLERYHDLARSLGMSVLVETHSKEEIAAANSIGAAIVGINNRDLGTFDVNLSMSLELRSLLRPGAIAVSESGIRTRADIEALQTAGFQAALVGEGIVTQPDRSRAVRELLA